MAAGGLIRFLQRIYSNCYNILRDRVGHDSCERAEVVLVEA